MGEKQKELKDVLVLVVEGIQKTQEALADGHLGLEDIPKAVTLFPEVVEAVKGLTSIPQELATMSDAEAKELVAFIDEKFALAGKAEEVTDATLAVCYSVWKLIQAIATPPAPPSA